MKFTEIAEAYNANVKNLDEARTNFEEEARNFIKTVTIFVNSETKKMNLDKSMKDSRFWNQAEVNGSKSSTPLGFYSETQLYLSIRPTGAKNFKNKGALVSFQVSFDDKLGAFSFKGILTNTDEVNEYLDEKLAEIAQGNFEKLPDAFRSFEIHKTREYVAFKAPLNNQLWDDFGKIVSEFLGLCDKTILAIFQPEPAIKPEQNTEPQQPKTTAA